MSEFEKPLHVSPSDFQGQTPYSDEELNTLRFKAWQEQSILIVSIDNPLLETEDKKLLRFLAGRLYSQEKSE